MHSSLRSDTQRIEQDTLPAAICEWIEELGVEAATETWNALLERIPDSHFMKQGFRNLEPPNLTWLFMNSGKGRGLNRFLDGAYDNWKAGSAWYDPTEGV